MAIKNWRGQDYHPVDDYLWFKTSERTRTSLVDLYNSVVGGSPERERTLKKFLSLLAKEITDSALPWEAQDPTRGVE